MKTTKGKGVLMAATLFLGIFLGGGIFRGHMLFAYAAQVPVVSECYLAQEAGGIKAGCRF